MPPVTVLLEETGQVQRDICREISSPGRGWVRASRTDSVSNRRRDTTVAERYPGNNGYTQSYRYSGAQPLQTVAFFKRRLQKRSQRYLFIATLGHRRSL